MNQSEINSIASKMCLHKTTAKAIYFSIQNCKDFNDDDLAYLSSEANVRSTQARECYDQISDVELEDIPKYFQDTFQGFIDQDHWREKRNEEIATGYL